MADDYHSLPSTSQNQINNRRLKLSTRHVSPIKEDEDNEMDEYAFIRLTILLSVVLFGLLVYLLIKVWRRRSKSRMPIIKKTRDADSGWTTALLESSDDEELLFTQQQ